MDPVTRIEGHLRIEAQVDAGKVSTAWSSATMWRGLEQILVGRDPREAWYFAQRICGVCTTVHALASVRAVEDALEITPPPNALLIRDLIAATQFVHDHVVHFYHLHALDWVDVTSALKADPGKAARLAASISDYPASSVTTFTAVKQRLTTFVNGGRLGPFANGYWGHPAYRLSPEVNLIAVAQLKAGPTALFSTLGRTLARGLESVVLAEHSLTLLDRLQANITSGDLRIHDNRLWDPTTWPKHAQGVGFHEAPRGALSHWVVIDNGRITNYQAVVPTTWNAGPRDHTGHPGPYETALIGTPLADPKQPLEILRTIHSFDPCMACAAHILDTDGNPVTEVRVQ